MRSLNGAELAGFIKERQAKAVRVLRQTLHVVPKLAIIRVNDDPAVDVYMRLKKRYGNDILIDVDVHHIPQAEAAGLIRHLNDDPSVHGIILQLPLSDPSETESLINLIAPYKDVDGLGEEAIFDSATPMAVNWLIVGYNIELTGKRILIVGNGRLVGAPLARMWRNSGYDVTVVDKSTADIRPSVRNADVVVTATGVPALIKSDMLRPDTVVVDAGVASEDGKLVGDLEPAVRERHDLIMTPMKGGVGPLTVSALFDNVIRAAQGDS